MSDAKGKARVHKIAAPKGTRDAYPEDVLRRRYVTQAWRDAAIRCGFDEIEGPTFEAAELYAVKSGDGILSELFQAFSGKSPDEVERVQREGKAPYALRPEFTPTLARMYAARAKQLPQPCKWFTAGPYFRAEKPQRGRLREFLQWNCDVIGLPGGEGQYAEAQSGAEAQRAEMDAEVIAPIVDLMHTLGFVSDSDACDILVRFNHRVSAANLFRACGVEESQLGSAFELADRRSKMDGTAFTVAAQSIGLDVSKFDNFRDAIIKAVFYSGRTDRPDMPSREQLEQMLGFSVEQLRQLNSVMQSVGAEELFAWDPHIVRGLAYYTGTVFEVIADGERAVAGGGRYDNLIELFGGPPTPACGFGMGDVVLSNLLDDKGLFPEGRELMEAVSRAPASVRPEAFVIHNGSDEARARVRPLVAALRRGVEAEGFDGKPWSAARYEAHAGGGGGVRPVHARQSYKATGNPGKLWSDGVKQHAMFIIEIGEGGDAQLKSVDRNETIGQAWSIDPENERYVGRGLVGALGGQVQAG